MPERKIWKIIWVHLTISVHNSTAAVTLNYFKIYNCIWLVIFFASMNGKMDFWITSYIKSKINAPNLVTHYLKNEKESIRGKKIGLIPFW
jgi:hypothetical protein